MRKKSLISLSVILLCTGFRISPAGANTLLSSVSKPTNSQLKISQNDAVKNNKMPIANQQKSAVKSTKQIIQKLSQASAGLLMPSESDYPFTVVSLEGVNQENLTPQTVLNLMGHSPDTLVEVTEVDYFFRNVAVEQEWHDRQQKQDVKKFQKLANILKSELNGVKVYRVGRINIDVYILGTYNNSIVGIKTKLVET
jgi:hypothetical protein